MTQTKKNPQASHNVEEMCHLYNSCLQPQFNGSLSLIARPKTFSILSEKKDTISNLFQKKII